MMPSVFDGEKVDFQPFEAPKSLIIMSKTKSRNYVWGTNAHTKFGFNGTTWVVWVTPKTT